MVSHRSTFDDRSTATLGAGALLQAYVVDRRGAVLGWIEDLVLDADSGGVAYVVLVVESAGARAKRFALPWHVLRFGGGDLGHTGDVVADLDRTALERSPGLPDDAVAKLSEPLAGEGGVPPGWPHRSRLMSDW